MSQFARREPALRALVQMPAQAALGPHPQAPAGISAEPVGVARAVAARGERLAHMGLQIGLLEPLTGAAGQYRRGVRRQSEQRRDVAGRLLLDGGVPQDGLPALGEAAERLHRHRLLGLVHRHHVGPEIERVGVRHLGAARRLRGEHREVVDQMLALRGLGPRGGDVPDRCHQVGPHCLLGPLAAPYSLECPGKDLGRQVVGGVRVAATGARVAAYGVGVANEQCLVREVVTVPHPLDQLRIGGGGPCGCTEGHPLHGHRCGGIDRVPVDARRALDRSGRPRSGQDGAARLFPVVRVSRPRLARHLVAGLPGRLSAAARGGDTVERLFLLPVTAHRGRPRMRFRTRTPG